MGLDKKFASTRGYDTTLMIKGKEYSNDLYKFRISTSLATGYQIVTLTLSLSPATILLNKLFGQDQITLLINLLDFGEEIIETMVFDLMIINSEFDIPITNEIVSRAQLEHEQVVFDIITVTRIPFEIMSTLVGVVFGINEGPVTPWTGPKTIKEMIESIVQEKISDGTLEYDTENENEDKILQCCIPPTTFYQAIKYLDNNYGLYDGAPAIFCQYDNTIQIMNLSTRIKKKYDFIINHLSTHTIDKDHKQVFIEDQYYTINNLSTNYTGNSKFGVLGKTLKHIVLPNDKLSHTITQDLSDVCEKYGLISNTKNEKSFVNTTAAKRTKYYINNNGFGISETHANSLISKEISNVSRLRFTINNSFMIEKLLKVGSVVKLKSKTAEYTDVQGKYILFSSDIIWIKDSDWSASGKIELIRTNK